MCSETSRAASSGSFCFDRVHDLLMLNIELSAAMFGGPVRGAAPHATFGTPQLAEGVAAALRERTAALMGNHGALTVGATLAVACQRVPYLEYVCEVHPACAVHRVVGADLAAGGGCPGRRAAVYLRPTRAAKLTTPDRSFKRIGIESLGEGRSNNRAHNARIP